MIQSLSALINPSPASYSALGAGSPILGWSITIIF